MKNIKNSPRKWRQQLFLLFCLTTIFPPWVLWHFAPDRYMSMTDDLLLSTVTMHGSPPPRELQRVFVAISFHYNVHRLEYLRESLETIGRWDTQVDACVGTNEPEKVLAFLHNTSVSSSWFRQVTCCPIRSLDFPMLLNWRTRETLKDAFHSNQNYTAFLFLEDDILITWPALQKWHTDTQILARHNFTRTFLRYEMWPGDGKPHALDVRSLSPFKHVALRDETDVIHHFVQPGEGMTYCAMLAATRPQLQAFIESEFWEWKGSGCCGEGGREDASWNFQLVNAPSGWQFSGLLPVDPGDGHIEPLALVHHLPNNYADIFESQGGHPSLEEINVQVRSQLALST